MKRLKLFLPLLAFLVLAGFLLRGLEKDPNAMPSALLNKTVPDFSLRLLDNSQTIVTAALFKGPALLNIWATWCGPCRVEHPFLNQLAGQGIKIYGINYKDDPSDALRWLAEKGNPYQYNVMDLSGTLGFDLGVFGAPETYLLDEQGIIRYKHVGVLSETVWQQDFVPLLNSFNTPK